MARRVEDVRADPPDGPTDPGGATGVRRKADAVAAAGRDVVEAVPPDDEKAVDLWERILSIDLRITRPLGLLGG